MALWGSFCTDTPPKETKRHYSPLSFTLYFIPFLYLHTTSSSLSPSFCSSRLPSLSPVSITASTQLSPAHYGVATAWVSPPVVTSCIRVPEAGRSDPVAQLKNILEENKDVETMPFEQSCVSASISYAANNNNTR